jgi:hypothetical protein
MQTLSHLFNKSKSFLTKYGLFHEKIYKIEHIQMTLQCSTASKIREPSLKKCFANTGTRGQFARYINCHFIQSYGRI